MSYSPLALSNYFNTRIRDFYPVPEGIQLQLFDHGYPNGAPEWHVTVANVDHQHPWEAPWGALNSPDFGRVFLKIALEIETKFGARFPRKEKDNG